MFGKKTNTIFVFSDFESCLIVANMLYEAKFRLSRTKCKVQNRTGEGRILHVTVRI